MARLNESSALDALFLEVESAYPERLRADGWYLTMIASLIGTNRAHNVGDLYRYIVAQTQYTTPSQRKRLVRRMREALVKCVILNGIPRVMIAVASLAREEREEDQDWFFSRKDWLPDAANKKRAADVLNLLYGAENASITATFGSHEDIPWISSNISYGLFLADHRVLSLLESELVILPAIMTQNVRGPTYWHLRGCLRVGITREEVEQIQQVIERIAEFASVSLDSVQRVADVTRE